GIPNLWHQFHQSVDHIPARIGKVAYGVCCNGDDAGNFDYVAGVEVADFSDLPREFARVRIPQQKYAVFTHAEHISTIRRTVNTIWNHWLPISGMKAADDERVELREKRAKRVAVATVVKRIVIAPRRVQGVNERLEVACLQRV